VPRVEIVPRGTATDPPEYIDVVNSGGTVFSLQRVNGAYFINGTGKLSQTAFTNALAQAFAVPT
jgi:hypothetical protein